jgi:HEAT repeat protein
VSAGNIQQLFLATLQGAYDDEAPWDAVRELQTLGTREVLDLATHWCRSEDPLRRAREADVLAQLGRAHGHASLNFPVETFEMLSELVVTETEVRPLSSAVYALGHLGNPASVPVAVRHAANLDPDVRHAVAFALGCYPNRPEAVNVLLKLTTDEDEHVRDWATFAIGVLGAADTVEIRDALVDRLSDPNEDAREEAVVGLAKRKDRRVLEPLLEMLAEPESGTRPFEAAAMLLDMSLSDSQLTRDDYVNLLKSRFF